MILDPFGPAPLQILVLRKQLVRLNYFIVFCNSHFLFLYIRFLLSLLARIAISIVVVQCYGLGIVVLWCLFMSLHVIV
jgi:hypothetical protein